MQIWLLSDSLDYRSNLKMDWGGFSPNIGELVVTACNSGTLWEPQIERFDKQCCFHTDLRNYLLVNCKSFRNVETFCCTGWICLHEKSVLYTLTSNISQITYVSINISTSCFLSVLRTLHSLQSSPSDSNALKEKSRLVRWIAEYGIPSQVLIAICILCTVTLAYKFFSVLPIDQSDSNRPRYVTAMMNVTCISVFNGVSGFPCLEPPRGDSSKQRG
jgi:hypothetical protein